MIGTVQRSADKAALAGHQPRAGVQHPVAVSGCRPIFGADCRRNRPDQRSQSGRRHGVRTAGQCGARGRSQSDEHPGLIDADCRRFKPNQRLEPRAVVAGNFVRRPGGQVQAVPCRRFGPSPWRRADMPSAALRPADARPSAGLAAIVVLSGCTRTCFAAPMARPGSGFAIRTPADR